MGIVSAWGRLLQKYPALAYVLPLAVLMLAGSLEPTPHKPGGQALGLAIPYAAYPWVYAVRIALTAAVLFAVRPGLRGMSLRITPLGILVGIVGAAVWIGCAAPRWELRLWTAVGLPELGVRSGFDPFRELAAPWAAWTFLAIRFLGLVALVPIVEELFLRGFWMRFFVAADWWKVSFGRVTPLAVVLGTVTPMLMHPGELLAAAAWFSLVTWLMVKTQSLADCMVAHAVTNLLLGVYVVATGHWWLM